jgi:murein DD-endopeptidase MepM/ murein hydrolase activator NlpD
VQARALIAVLAVGAAIVPPAAAAAAAAPAGEAAPPAGRGFVPAARDSGPSAPAFDSTIARSAFPVGGHPARIVPFTPSDEQRNVSATTPSFRFGRMCARGCRPSGARAGWPIKPFDRQHGLRAGLNELRLGSMHVGVDIQARNGQAVYAMQSGTAKVFPDPARIDSAVQVGNYQYIHINPAVANGQYVEAYGTIIGHVLTPAGHVHLSELRDRFGGSTEGNLLDPLRPGGRVLAPYVDTIGPVIGPLRFSEDGRVDVDAYDPQSFAERSSYWTPVLAPAALAYRVTRDGGRSGPLHFALQGTHVYPFSMRSLIYGPGSRGGGWECFARYAYCTPTWRYHLAGGLAPALRLHPGIYTLTAYAWDWSDNVTARGARFVVQ